MAGETVIQNGLIVKGPITATGGIVGDCEWINKGTWDASSGVLPAPVGLADGWYYRVSTAGTTDGVAFRVGDFIRYQASGAYWETFSSVLGANTGLCAALCAAGAYAEVQAGAALCAAGALIAALCASSIEYTAVTPADWCASSPAAVSGALNRLAAALADHTGLGVA